MIRGEGGMKGDVKLSWGLSENRESGPKQSVYFDFSSG